MNSEERFLNLLNALARSCNNFELDKTLIGMFDKHLSPFGYDRVNQALEDILVERESYDPFPSVAFILRAMNADVSDKTLAEDVANRILASIQRHDYIWPQGTYRSTGNVWYDKDQNVHPNFQAAFESECGSLGWAIIEKMGGYIRLCDEWRASSSLTTLRAQIRECSKSTIELSRNGKLFIPPALPEGKGTERFRQLVGDTIKTIPGGNK